jgi:hypothetical protein
MKGDGAGDDAGPILKETNQPCSRSLMSRRSLGRRLSKL